MSLEEAQNASRCEMGDLEIEYTEPCTCSVFAPCACLDTGSSVAIVVNRLNTEKQNAET